MAAPTVLLALLTIFGTSRGPAFIDYTKPQNWVCRPDRNDVCSSPVTAAVIAANGRRSTHTYTPDPAAPIDCFYAYPTVPLQNTT